ncbi:hypothetical protein [Catenuloplanes indicus]|uniref:NACHT domain-containing protein n=1 Tax=Catenuloplanes indicus TaxID=137267 RepID=A0AAE4B210_9ACTN|nr:hypothetical protein [Catenuloplanes indicus]MDQ0371209.1 hypothetical protein [Catenuloplanes indicus]
MRLSDSPAPPEVLTAVGFSLHTPGAGVQPDSLRLTVVGRSGDGYLRVKDDEIVDGMSGAPAVDGEGRLHGIVKASRDYDRPRGGWIIPATIVATQLQEHWRTPADAASPRSAPPPIGDPRLRRLLTAQAERSDDMPYRLTDGPSPGLSSIYVSPQATPRSGASAIRAEQMLSVREMVGAHRHTLLVGGPGAGKSSLLRRIVHETAGWHLRDDAEKGPPPYGWVVPVRIPATALLAGEPWAAMIAGAVHADLGDLLGGDVTPAMFGREPWPGLEWLLLIDGLDEVMDPERRERLIGAIAHYMGGYGSHWRILVASRGLLQAEFDGLRSRGVEVGTRLRFEAYELLPFDRGRLAAFAAKWFELRDPGRAPERTAAFLDRVSHSRLSHLVAVPLLATIAAIVHEKHPDDPLPIDRTGLYRRFVHGLLYERPSRAAAHADLRTRIGRFGPASQRAAELLAGSTEECLEEIATVMLARDDDPDATGVGMDWLRERVTGLPDVPALVADVRSLLVNTGLLVVAWDRLAFVHRGFAEYLAAGLRVRSGFAPRRWLRQVRRRGLDNVSLFTLARWTGDRHDPVPILVVLLLPGPRLRFPALIAFCEVLEDGLPLPPDAIRRLTTLARWALRLGRLDDATVAAVLESLAARDPDGRVLSTVAAGRAPAGRRLVAARMLVTHGSTAADRAFGARVLTELGTARSVSRRRRFQALHTLAHDRDADARARGVATLVRLVESAPVEADRFQAIDMLLGLGETAAIRRALLLRAARSVVWSDQVAAMGHLVQLEHGAGLERTATVSGEELAQLPAHLRPNLVGADPAPFVPFWVFRLPYDQRRHRLLDPPVVPPAAHSLSAAIAHVFGPDEAAGPADGRVEALDRADPRAADVAALLGWVRSADRPVQLRLLALTALRRLGATDAGVAAADEVLTDPRTPAGLAVHVLLVLARAYGLRAEAAQTLRDRADRPGGPLRERVTAGLALLALRLDRLPGARGWPRTTVEAERYARREFDWAPPPPRLTAAPAPALDPFDAALAALTERHDALPVTAPADSGTLAEAVRALHDQRASAEVAQAQRATVRQAAGAGRTAWWAALRAELATSTGPAAAARLALAASLAPAAAAQAGARAAWVRASAVTRLRRAAGIAGLDGLYLGVLLVTGYLMTGTAALAVLSYGGSVRDEAVLDGVATVQARLAVPVLALLLVLIAGPRRPGRDVPAARQVAPAATLFAAVAVWHGGDRFSPPVWDAAVAPFRAVDGWLVATVGTHTAAAVLIGSAGWLALLVAADKLDRRVRAVPPSEHPRVWTAFRFGVLALAAAWLPHTSTDAAEPLLMLLRQAVLDLTG